MADYINNARDVFDIEIQALNQTRDILDETFVKILEIIINCQGKIVLCGMGKSGHIAKKISATFASLGTPSFYVHPAEALHGDLGMVSSNDVIVLISHSGESQEVVRLIPSLKLIGARLIAITSKAESTLAKECEIVQCMPEVKEACSLNLAPTSSTTAVLVYGDALAVMASKKYGFNEESFGLFHPAGTLGKKIIIKVKDIMAHNEEVPVIVKGNKIIKAIIEMSEKGLGVVAIVDEKNKLVGILTDGDLRRAIEKKVDLYNDIIDTIMTVNPKYVGADVLAVEALQRLKVSSLNNFPVIDDEMRVIGMLTWQMIIKEGIIL